MFNCDIFGTSCWKFIINVRTYVSDGVGSHMICCYQLELNWWTYLEMSSPPVWMSTPQWKIFSSQDRWSDCGGWMWRNNAIYSLIAVLHISSMSRKSKPMLTLCRQTRTEQWPGARLSGIAYKYNLLIVLKILSYTLYRKQLEEIVRRAFSKTEQDWWSVPGLA